MIIDQSFNADCENWSPSVNVPGSIGSWKTKVTMKSENFSFGPGRKFNGKHDPTKISSNLHLHKNLTEFYDLSVKLDFRYFS